MKIILSGFILMVMYIGVNFYVIKSISGLTKGILPIMMARIITAVLVILSLLVCLNFIFMFSESKYPFRNIIQEISGYWMGFFAYIIMFFIAKDLMIWIIHFFISIDEHDKLIAGNIAFILAIGVSMFGFFNATRIADTKYNIELNNKLIGKSMKVVLISDVHLGAAGSERKLPKIVKRVNSEKPDLICIAGDLIDTNYKSIKDPEKAKEELRKLKAKYGVYSCVGNHDSGKTFSQMMKFVNDSNIICLTEDFRVIHKKFVLVGRLDSKPIGYVGGYQRQSINSILKKVILKEKESTGKTNLPIIVMDHNPLNIKEYGKNIDLVLSGHTHRGQIWPGNLITGAMYQIDYGHIKENKNSPHVIVSSGVGIWGPPMRVGSNCEIVTINIK